MPSPSKSFQEMSPPYLNFTRLLPTYVTYVCVVLVTYTGPFCFSLVQNQLWSVPPSRQIAIQHAIPITRPYARDVEQKKLTNRKLYHSTILPLHFNNIVFYSVYFFLSFSHVTLIPINGVCDKKLNTERTGVKSRTQTELTNTKKKRICLEK